MISQLVYFLFFEAIEPSYGLLMGSVPDTIVASALHQGSLANSLAPMATPIKKAEQIAPVVQATSVYSIDLRSGTPLVAKEIFAKRSIASITKLVTAMVVLDSHDLSEEVLVSRNAAQQEGSGMGLRSGEKITVGDLMKGLLTVSGNDAAVALAEHDAGSEKAFVEKMNNKISALGLLGTHFSNAKGFDEPNNYSTAYDTMRFSRAALDYKTIRDIAATQKTTVTSIDGKITHTLESTDELLDNPHFKIKGLKTGTTPLAGESFVSLSEMQDGTEILTVLLGSPDRFQETKVVLDWIARSFTFPTVK